MDRTEIEPSMMVTCVKDHIGSTDWVDEMEIFINNPFFVLDIDDNDNALCVN